MSNSWWCVLCKEPSEVIVETTAYCIPCLTKQYLNARKTLEEVSTALREGLEAWPKVMDYGQFTRICIEMHREDAVTQYLRDHAI